MSEGADDRHAPYRGARVLVLGASGFIGRWVAGALAASGARPWLVVRHAGTVPARPGATEEVVADLSDQEQVRALVAAWRPDVVFNLAGYGVDRGERDEHAAHAVNAGLPRWLAESLAACPADAWAGQRLVHVGSALEYGEIGGDLAEDSEPHATTLYGQTKLAGTRAVARVAEERGVAAVVARLFTVYGAGEHDGRLLPTLLSAARHDAPIPLSEGRQQRDFTYVEDVAEGLLRLGAVPAPVPGTVVNLATGRLTTVREFVATGARVLGIAPARLDFGALPTRAEEMRHDPVSVARLEAVLHWRPRTPIDEGIVRAARRAGVVD